MISYDPNLLQLYNDYYKALKRDESCQLNYNNHYQQLSNNGTTRGQSPDDNPMPTTSTAKQLSVTFNAADIERLQRKNSNCHQQQQHKQQHNHQQHQHKPSFSSKMTDCEIVMTPRRESGQNGSNMCQYHTRLLEQYRYERYQQQQQHQQQQLYDEECLHEREKLFNSAVVKDLRWIHWRMTLFMFYWIVWFIFLIGVIIIVALRAKS